MKTTTLKIFPLLAALGVACISPATAAVSDTVGYNTITCLANSDTIVGVPLRQSGSIKGSLNGVPDTSEPGFATLTLSAAPSETGLDEFSYYLQFTSGTKNGQYFTIGVNGGTSVTIDLVDGNLDGVIGVTTETETADTFIIAKYWTLNDLFPPAEATTEWDGEGLQNGHAIVQSGGTNKFFRKTIVLIAPSNSSGINPLPDSTHYLTANSWLNADGDTASGGTLLFPDSVITIRQPNISNSTKYTLVGEVQTETLSIPLVESASKSIDNVRSIPRPIDLKLTELNLINVSEPATSPFTPSTGTNRFFRKDLLMVFDNTTSGINKLPLATYYYDQSSGNWRDSGDDSVADNDTIPAGSGITIRKAKGTEEIVDWSNDSSY